ncbi:MAG: Na/Pi cotransporter family protein [Fuerstiella sp.]
MILAVNDSADYGTMLMGLFGGLAIFLFGMEQMTSTLKVLAGERMKGLLGRLTSNRFKGVFAGAFVTSVIQSSSVTTVLVVGFVSAGLMTLPQSVGVIMGAEIGTTITAQIIAFKVTKAALAIVAIGFAIQFLSGRKRLGRYGTMILGFGLLFFGINVMSDATRPLHNFQPFIDTVRRLDSPIPGILLSAAFTAVIQSSSATTILIIVLAGQQLISLQQAIPLILGANIGTCVTALLAAIGKPREAVRAAVIHVLFNSLGVVLWYSFIDTLASVAQQLSSSTSRQIAHSHTIFNVTNTCVFIWFTTPLARLVTFLVPDRADTVPDSARPKFLDEILFQTPPMALDAVRMELGRLGAGSLRMVRGALTAVVRGDIDDLERLEAMDDDVDSLHAAIVSYLGQLSRENLSIPQSNLLHDYLLAANYFENIGDMIESNLVAVGRHRIDANLAVSAATEQVMEAVHHEVCRTIDHAVRAVVDQDPDVAREVLDAKAEINQLVAAAEEHLSRRLSAPDPNRLVAFRLESEVMEYLKRMYYYAKRTAKLVVDEGQSETTATAESSPEPEADLSAAT